MIWPFSERHRAISLTERALQIRLQALGEVHPKTVATRTLHAQLVQEQAAGAEKTAAEQEGETMAGACIEVYQVGRASLPLHEEDDLFSSARDPLKAFLEACCDLHPRAWCRSAELWQAYTCWVEYSQDRYPLSRGEFIVRLKAHGCSADRTKTARIWRGIALGENGDDGR